MRPTSRSLLVMVGGLPLALSAVFGGGRFWVLWLVYLCMCLVLIGLDIALAGVRRKPRITMTIPSPLYIGRPGIMRVDLALPGQPVPARIEVLQELDALLHTSVLETVSLDDQGQAVAEITLTARRRGETTLGNLWLRWTGPLGLVVREHCEPVGQVVPVVPDIQTVRSAALRFFGSQEFLSGSKLEQYSGDGSEFDRLREFVPGLDHRSIDWKSSARHCKLLSREFRAERNHQVVIAVDTGHLMAETIGGVPKLDHAINTGLLLSYYCLRTGDRVGLFGFDKKVNLYREPVGGVAAFAGLHMASSQLAYSAEETNFTLGLAQLSTFLKQRSLIVLITDFVDTISARLMEENLRRLSRRHLVVFVALRNPEVAQIVGERPDTIRNMARSVVAADILQEREVVLAGLQRYGIQTLDAAPSEVSPELLNRYLDIKRREQIA